MSAKRYPPKQTVQELKELQSLPLDAKIAKSKQRIFDWYTHFNGNVYVSFSGGKDSTVLLHLVRSEFPDVPAVYSRTPDYPDVAKFATSQKDITIVNPKMPFHQIVREYGYPIISKEVSECIYYARRDRGGGVSANPCSQAIMGLTMDISQINKHKGIAQKTVKQKQSELTGRRYDMVMRGATGVYQEQV